MTANIWKPAFATLVILLFSTAAGATAATPTGSFSSQDQGESEARSDGPKEYAEVITEDAHTKSGMFSVHEVGDDLFFEIPEEMFGREMLLIGRASESTTQDPGSFFGSGPLGRLFVEWELDEERVILRAREYDLTANPDASIWAQVSHFGRGAILSTFDVKAFAPRGGAVINVSDLFISNIPELNPVEGIQASRSWVENFWALEDRVNVEVTQTGQNRAGGDADGPARQRSQTVRVFFSMSPLPEEQMTPRWHDERVGFNSSRAWDFSRPDRRLDQVRFIHRFRLDKRNPEVELSDPIEPIVYWIDPATPKWLQPWIEVGVNRWQVAFEDAGFSNAIFGRVAPTKEEDPDFSLYDARTSAIYWRPSSVANATGGQIVDPRTGEILKGEVNMYHNIMDLMKRWYFIQVGPLDKRAQSFPLPDSLMGRLVEYVVTHEIGHSIGFPHNMKSSGMYPADSLRDVTFLERMGGSHVATLMDYSRFNYVAQPEDGIPLEYLIPKVGPYDRYAVRWGYSVIPGASTPDEERATLNAWAREQDAFPWLRFSTADAEGSDPNNLTEAVGDEDAVKSNTLGMRNLDRVMDMLLDVTEVEGESYAELENMYGQAVSQWGRYMGHVIAIVGGAHTQEKYGTGPRFEPMARERQAEAVEYLNRIAFHIPDMFLNPDILRRIEPEGVVDRFRDRQKDVLGQLLSRTRLERLIEFGATDAMTYTITDLMNDLRGGIWDELGRGRVSVNTYRRNLHRAFLAVVDDRLHPSEREMTRANNPVPAPWTSDIRAVLRAELEDLDTMAEEALHRAGDTITRIHLRDVRREIERILNTER